MMYAKRKFDPNNPNRLGYGYGMFTAIGVGLGVSTAAAVAVTGAGIMAAGSLLGIKEAAPIGGLMMAGGGIASGIAGLGLGGAAATVSGTLGTLSAGASLVGGALQGVGILTGNNKLSGIGGLINGAGMMGSSFGSPSVLPGGDVAATTGSTYSGGLVNGSMPMLDPVTGMPQTTGMAGGMPNNIGGAAGSFGGATPPINPAAAGAADSKLLSNIQKYDGIIKLGGDIAKGVATSKQQNDILNQNALFQSQNLAEHRRNTTAVAIPGNIPVSAPAVPVMAQQVVPNPARGIFNASNQQVPGYT